MTGRHATFRVGLSRCARAARPRPIIDAAVKLIGEAKAGGADYVQTPEMTNIMERQARASCSPRSCRRRTMPTLATFRELARTLGI